MNNIDGQRILKDVYALIAELWCNPPEPDANRVEIKKNAKDVIRRLQSIDEESAMLLSKFLKQETIAEEDYIDLFELDPKCALYLGSHTFDEPTTCANSAVSDRNGYMIELVGIYNHFGRKPVANELPDYLPLMVDFLSLTTEAKDDPVRGKFINEYILPHLPAMHSKLGALETPYIDLLEALEKVVSIDQETQATSEPCEQEAEHYVG
jgi:nitrate reductase delta subunit